MVHKKKVRLKTLLKLFILYIKNKSFFIVALFVVIISGCENDPEKIKLITGNKKSYPVESGNNLEIFYSDSAHVKVKIITPELNRYHVQKPYMELPKGLYVEFYDNKMEVTSTLLAKYAIRKELEKTMDARNDVVVVNKKGEKLNTEHLIWDEKTGKIYSDAFVKITTPDEILFGDGLESNEDFSKYKILNPKGTITVNKDANAKNS